MQKRLTICDIAELAQVSASTVSRCLNDSPLVADSTKQRILEIARRGEFSFNATAQRLVTRRTGIIGLICPDSFDEYQYSLHLTLLINSIRNLLETHDLDLIVKFRRDARGKDSIRGLLKSKKVDGLIIINPDVTPDDVSYMREAQIPFVFVQAIPPRIDLTTENYVFADHVTGGTIATDHLVRLGHRRVLCFTVDISEGSFTERTRGYRNALEAHGIPVDPELIRAGNGTFEFGYRFVKDNAHLFSDGVTAIFSQTDIMALGAIEGLWHSGFEVPRDVAIVSYDDIGFGKDFRPRLTTVHQPRDRLAVAACNRLKTMLDGGSTHAGDASGKNEHAHGGGAGTAGIAAPGTEDTPGAGAAPGTEDAILQVRVQPYLVVRESCGAE